MAPHQSVYPIMTADLVDKYDRVTVTIFGKPTWTDSVICDMLDKAAKLQDDRVSHVSDNYVTTTVAVMTPGLVVRRDYFVKRKFWGSKK